jgi:Raf kinase inhibitor-like YbhB/YbcL family protein
VIAECSRRKRLQRACRARLSAALVVLSLTVFAGAPLHAQPKEDAMKLTSPAFANGAEIPARYTCEGEDLSPPLAWSGVPAGAKSLALVVDDPDAPDPKAPLRNWVHWVAYNFPPSASRLAEGVKELPAGARQGQNDWQRPGYGGPCPPIGRHRYFHKLYALDTVLPDLGGATKQKLETAMRGHILAEAQLVGTYEKQRR